MRRGVATWPLVAAVVLPACDLEAETTPPARGPDLHALATYPRDGAGTECRTDAPDDCGVPLDAAIEIRFDRFLLPKTATRQSLRVYSASPEQSLFLVPTYDLVERVVSFRPAYGAGFVPGALYRAELFSPPGSANGAGFRAFDSAPLVQSGSAPLGFSFRMAKQPRAPVEPEASPTCGEALDAFARGGCIGCHTGGDAALGLELGSASGLRDTAVGQLSREVEGPNVEQVLVDPSHFGLGLSRIEAGSPSSSYLFYKLLLAPENYGPGDGDCITAHRVALPEGICVRPNEDERRRAADWFVRLDPMPPTGGLAGGTADLRLIADYIRAGADTTTCD